MRCSADVRMLPTVLSQSSLTRQERYQTHCRNQIHRVLYQEAKWPRISPKFLRARTRTTSPNFCHLMPLPHSQEDLPQMTLGPHTECPRVLRKTSSLSTQWHLLLRPLSFLGPGLCSSNVLQRTNVCPQQSFRAEIFQILRYLCGNLPDCGTSQPQTALK